MSLIADDYELQQSDDGLFLSVAKGTGRLAPPPARRTSTIIPLRTGRRLEPGLADVRVVPLTGWIKKPDPAELVAELDRLKVLFDAARDPWPLRDTLPDGSVRWIHVRGRSVMGTYLNPHTYELDVELEALDPFWYAAYGMATLDSGLELDDGEALDQGAPVTLTPLSDPHAFAIDTMSTAEVERVRVRMTGPSLGGPGLEVDTPEGIVGFELATPLLAGEELDLDNYARTVLVAGSSRRWDMTLKPANRNGEYARLRPGVNAVRVLGQPSELRIGFTRTFL